MPSKPFGDRLKHAWDVFRDKDASSSTTDYVKYGYGSSVRLDRPVLRMANERTILSAIYNKIAIDVAAIPIKHVRVDENDRYLETIKDGLNECLNLSANIDQTGRALMTDIVLSMFDEGYVAVVPVVTSENMLKSGSFDIEELRTGKIKQWYPDIVRVEVYNERIGQRQEIDLPKDKVAIIENPLYTVMNERGSVVQRLISKMNLMDVIDAQAGSTKLDLILQLPYTIKTERKQEEANKRIKMIEDQLQNSPYGVAYVDGTEKITQLNRSLENNLMGQIEYLTNMLYGQLGITKEVFDGTADEKTTLNYYNSTVEPILAAITDEMKRKFLTKTARSQGQSLMYIRDPFKLVAVGEIAEIADKFSRNEILTGNELRGIVGFMPSDDANADMLYNPNMPYEDTGASIGDLTEEEINNMSEDELNELLAQM